MKKLEEIRKTPNLFIDAEAENDGMGGRYYDKQTGKFLHFIFSYQMGWEHLSVSMPTRCPSWEQMCVMKDIFWNKDECCVEYHPREEDYVNNHPYCLHIWKPTDVDIPTPPTLLIGFRNEEEKEIVLQIAKENGIKINNFKFKKGEK